MAEGVVYFCNRSGGANSPGPKEAVKQQQYAATSRVWLSAEDRGHWYEAKVIEIRPGVEGNAGNVKVHRKGFSTRLDSWVPLIPSRIRGVCTRSSISRVCKEKYQEQQTQRNSDRNEDIANKGDDNAADAAKKDVGAVDPISSAFVPASTESLDPRLFEHEDAVAVWSRGRPLQTGMQELRRNRVRLAH